jgi:hypothetical protein
MSPRKSPKTERVSREEIILALSQAKLSAKSGLKDSPQYVAGYADGIGLAIDLIRAVEDIEKAILREDYERR